MRVRILSLAALLLLLTGCTSGRMAINVPVVTPDSVVVAPPDEAEVPSEPTENSPLLP